MTSKLVLGSTGEEVSSLQKSLKMAGYGEYITQDGVFDEGTSKSLLMFQRAMKYEEASPYRPEPYSTVFVSAGPLYDTSGNRTKMVVPEGFYIYTGETGDGRSNIKLFDGSLQGSVQSSQIYRKRPYAYYVTFSKIRQYFRTDPDYRYDWYKKAKEGPKVSQIIGNIRGSTSGLVNTVGNITGVARGYIQDTFASIGMVTSWIQNLVGRSIDTITEDDIYIVDLTKTQVVIALPMIPSSVNISGGANWTDATPTGRTAGYHGYNYTQDRSVNFGVDLYLRDFDSKDSYQQCINNLIALSYPEYESGIVKPPLCYVNLPGQIKFTGYCTSSMPQYDGDIVEKVYSHARFTLGFKSISDIPYTAQDIRDGQEFFTNGYGGSVGGMQASNISAINQF